MNIVITGTGFSFPEGTGASARVMALAKGLVHHGATVQVFCPKPTEIRQLDAKQYQVEGNFEGIPFEYTCGRRTVAKTRVGALLLYLRGLWRACVSIRRIHKKTPVDAILLWYAEFPINFLVFSILAKMLNVALIAEKSEFPFVYSRNSVAVRIKRWFFEHVAVRYIDGVMVISTFLHDYFATRSVKAARLIRVPILVASEFFEHPIAKIEQDEKTILYCGNLRHDGEVAGLLEAFGQLAGDFPRWRVEIIGPMEQSNTAKELEAIVERYGLADRVLFSGAIKRCDLPNRLAKGDIMALPRASGAFSTAGFPTKLGEYLATGRPVVVTDTGDIADFLIDRDTAYLVVPDDINAFSDRLRYVMTHSAEAAHVGRRGCEVARHEFDARTHSKRLMDFIVELRDTRSKTTAPHCR